MLYVSQSIILLNNHLSSVREYHKLFPTTTILAQGDKESLRTIPVGLAGLTGQYNTNWGPMRATMVVATVPTIIIYVLFSGQIQKSLVVGSVKG